jgi:uncharacterized protein YbjT (DUF2867 family)
VRRGSVLLVLSRRALPESSRIEVHHGDVTNPAVVDVAVNGVDVVIPALNGGPEVLVTGRLALLAAAERHHVSRFVPSDYSGDFFGRRGKGRIDETPEGDT